MRLGVLLSCYGWFASAGDLNSAHVETARPQVPRIVALAPLPPAMVEALSHPSASALKGPLQIGLGRPLDQPLLVSGQTTGSTDWRHAAEWAEVAASVARMTYVAGRNTYLCTGCLLATADGSSPADYFLTARHCITSQAFASTIELYWLYQTSECNGPPPDLATVPHTTGGALIVASGVPSDFCFMRLRRPAPSN